MPFRKGSLDWQIQPVALLSKKDDFFTREPSMKEKHLCTADLLVLTSLDQLIFILTKLLKKLSASTRSSTVPSLPFSKGSLILTIYGKVVYLELS